MKLADVYGHNFKLTLETMLWWIWSEWMYSKMSSTTTPSKLLFNRTYCMLQLRARCVTLSMPIYAQS